MPQDLALYEEISGLDNLKFFGRLYGLSGSRLGTAIATALETVGLSDRAGDTVSEYSGGMKRRLNLAAGLLHDPEILILDEPTVGVDPQSRNHIFDNVERLNAAGTTVVYTTHYMEEAERLCDRVAIVDNGKLVALAPPVSSSTGWAVGSFRSGCRTTGGKRPRLTCWRWTGSPVPARDRAARWICRPPARSTPWWMCCRR